MPLADADRRLIIDRAETLDAGLDAVIATDLDGEILYWSRAAEALYGWSAEEVLGRSIVDVTPSDASREEAKQIMASLSRGGSWHGQFAVRKKSGEALTVDVRDFAVRGPLGGMIGVIGVSRLP